MSKPRLYLLTDRFPAPNGEASFILPELPFLQNKFEVTVVTTAPVDEKVVNDAADQYIKQFDTIHIDVLKMPRFNKMYYRFRAFFSIAFLDEAIHVIKTRKLVLRRIKYINYYYACAVYFFCKLSQIIKIDNTRENIFYNYWFNYKTLASVMFLNKNQNLKIITRAHGYDLYIERSDVLWQPFKKFIGTKINGIFFISEQGRQYFIDNYADNSEIIKNKSYLSYLGVPDRGINNISQEESEYIIVSCAAVLPVKRVELIPKALSGIEDIKIRWIHFGGGIGYRELLRVAETELGNKSNISFELKGQVENQEIIEYYKNHPVSCFISTSSSEGMPVSIMEAMSFGIPIIATNVGGISEAVNNNGFLMSADPTSEEVLICIEKLFSTKKAEIDVFRKNSREIWRRKFDSKKNSQMFVDTIAELV